MSQPVVLIDTGETRIAPDEALVLIRMGLCEEAVLVKTLRNLRKHAFPTALVAAEHVHANPDDYPQRVWNIAYNIAVVQRN